MDTAPAALDVPRPDAQTQRGENLRVLLLMQAAFVLLGGVGETLLMGGNGLYLALPALKAVLLMVLGRHIARRWALRTVLILQVITLTGFVVQLGAGLLPQVDFTVNLVGLLTTVALPAGMVWLCRRS